MDDFRWFVGVLYERDRIMAFFVYVKIDNISIKVKICKPSKSILSLRYTIFFYYVTEYLLGVGPLATGIFKLESTSVDQGGFHWTEHACVKERCPDGQVSAPKYFRYIVYLVLELGFIMLGSKVYLITSSILLNIKDWPLIWATKYEKYPLFFKNVCYRSVFG